MANTYKVLGQVIPAANTATTLYTTPANTSAVISTISICNQATSGCTVRLAIRPVGATLDPKHYVVYDTFVAANDTLFLTIGISIAATDVITVQSSNAYTSFNMYGTEVV